MSIKTKTPEAYIAINKGRVKFYPANQKNKVYLQDKQEFQIELFNPTTNTISAVISFNGIESKSAIVLKPGQRYFLDRFMDNDSKLKFDTYEVEDSSEVKEAIAKNGLVGVKFYNEKKKITIPIVTYTYPTYTYTTQNNPNIYKEFNPLRSNNSGDYMINGLGSTNNQFNCSYSLTSSSINNDNSVGLDSAFDSNLDFFPSEAKTIETGRIEGGEKSNQKFTTVDMDFELFAFASVSYTLLPVSQKPVEVQDLIRKYCSNCGNKFKQTDNFCTNCGVKL